MTEILLAILALLLFTGLLILGIFSAIVVSFFKWEYAYFKRYCFDMAGSIDQTGNVVMSPLFNVIMIKMRSPHKFGNMDEKISSVLGRNKETGNLIFVGILLDKILDWVDPNHSIKSIGS